MPLLPSLVPALGKHRGARGAPTRETQRPTKICVAAAPVKMLAES